MAGPVHGAGQAFVDRHGVSDVRREQAQPGPDLQVGAVGLDEIEIGVGRAEQPGGAGEDRPDQLIGAAALEERARRLVQGGDERVTGAAPQPRALGQVEGRVGRLDEGILCRAVVRVAGQPDADRGLRPGRIRAQGFDRRPDALGDLVGAGPATVGQDHRELVAAVAIGAVARPDRGLDRPGDAGQEQVARGVAERVVVGLEAVEIHHQEGERAVAWGVDRRPQLALEAAVVAEAGEGVVLGPDLDLAVRLRVAEGDRRLGREQLRQLELVLREVRLLPAHPTDVQGAEDLALGDERDDDERLVLGWRAGNED
jgi:hypothetical protein